MPARCHRETRLPEFTFCLTENMSEHHSLWKEEISMFRMRTLYVCASNQKLNSCIGLMLNWERDTPVPEGRWDGSRELRRRSLPARSQTES